MPSLPVVDRYMYCTPSRRLRSVSCLYLATTYSSSSRACALCIGVVCGALTSSVKWSLRAHEELNGRQLYPTATRSVHIAPYAPSEPNKGISGFGLCLGGSATTPWSKVMAPRFVLAILCIARAVEPRSIHVAENLQTLIEGALSASPGADDAFISSRSFHQVRSRNQPGRTNCSDAFASLEDASSTLVQSRTIHH